MPNLVFCVLSPLPASHTPLWAGGPPASFSSLRMSFPENRKIDQFQQIPGSREGLLEIAVYYIVFFISLLKMILKAAYNIGGGNNDKKRQPTVNGKL